MISYIPVDFNPFAEELEIEKVAFTNESQREIWLSCVIGGDGANLSYNESVSLVITGNFKFIAFQKYIALCGVDAVESWSDFRRGVLVLPSGYLSWNPVVRNNASATLPNVLPYPQTEFTTNAVSIPTPNRNTASLFTEKLFWQP